MSFTTTALVVTWAALALLSFAVAGLMRQVLVLSRGGARPVEPVGPRPGKPVPSIGANAAWTRESVVLFLSDDCPSCHEVVPAFAGLAETHDDDDDFIAVFAGRSAGNGLGERVRTVTGARSLLHEYDVPVLPFAVRVSEHGVVVDSAPVGSVARLHAFVEKHRRREEVQ